MARVTIKDLARETGLSIATVSYVLNGRHHKVSSKTIELVQSTVSKLGYQKNQAAAALRRNERDLIQVLMPQIPQNLTLQDTPFFSDFLAGIESGASESGIQFAFSRISDAEQLEPLIKAAKPIGVIVVGSYPKEVEQVISEWDLKTVIVDQQDFIANYGVSDTLISCEIDDDELATLAIKHLYQLGHKQIGLVFAPIEDSVVHRRRLNAIRQFAEDNGIYTQLHIVNAEESHTDTRFESVLLEAQQCCSALLCMSDVLALRCLRAASRHNINIPDNLSLIGMDGLHLLNFLPLKLTTVDQQITVRGYNSVMELIAPERKKPVELRVLEGETCSCI